MPEELVAFSAVEPVKPEVVKDFGRWVWRRAPLAFRAGSYPDKNFSVSADEIKAAVEHFNAARRPINFDLEHLPTVLKDKLGGVFKATLNPDGASFGVDTLIPRWLHEEVKGPLPISAQFDRATKRLKGFAITCNPRIEDAKLLASFAMDMASAGPMPPPPATDSYGSAPCLHGPELFQAVWNMLDASEQSAQKSPDIYSKSYLGTLAKMKKTCEDNGANQGSGADDTDTGSEGFSVTPAKPAAGSGASDPRDERIARLEAQLLNERKARVTDGAVAFANGPAVLKRFRPDDQADLITMYTALAEQDAVNFANNPQAPTSLLEQWKQQCLKRPEHGLTAEAAGAQTGTRVVDATFSTPAPAAGSRPGEAPATGQPMSRERRRSLLSRTETGRKLLAEEDARGAPTNGAAARA